MFLRQMLSVFATQMIAFVATFLGNIVLARALGAAGKGQVTLLTTFVFLLSLTASLGLGPASIYYVNRNIQERKAVVSSALLLQSVLVLFLLIPVFALAPWIAKDVLRGEVSRMLLLLTLITLPLTALVGAISSLLVGLQEIARSNYLRLFQTGVQFGLFLVLLVILRLGVTGAIVAQGLSVAAASLLGFVFLKRCGMLSRWRLSRAWVKPLFAYGLKSWPGNMLQFFNYRLDIFILNLFASAVSVGQYSVAVGLAEMIWFLPTAVALILLPRTAADWDRATRFTPLVARNTLLVTALSAAGIALVSHPLIKLAYGHDFVPASTPLLILLPGVVCLGVGKVLASDLAGRGKPHYGAWSALIALVLTVGLDLLFIPRWASAGAALASTLSYALSAAILLYQYVRLSGNSVKSIVCIQRSDLQAYVTKFKEYTTRQTAAP